MRARGPRVVLALLITSGAGALGLGALGAAAHAASAAGKCLGPCTSAVTVTGIDADGMVHVSYNETNALNGFDSASTAATITWAGPAKPPDSAPPPQHRSAPLINPMCTGTSPSPVTCTFSFPPAMMINKYILNGTYSVTATANDCVLGGLNCTPVASDPTTLTLTNPPTAPTGVMAVAQGSTAKISWAPSPEPDIARYQVLRADGSLACLLKMTAKPPTEYACTDIPAKDGSYTYHVVAYRWGPAFSDNVKDLASGPDSLPSKPVSLTGTSSNPTTTVPAGTGTPGGVAPVLTPKKGSTPAVGGPTLRLTPNTGPAVGGSTATTADPGFAPTLPYAAQPQAQDPASTNPSAVSAPPPAPHKGPNSVATIAVVGAGLLIAVIALHGLWLRSEVRRVPVLEVLDPEH